MTEHCSDLIATCKREGGGGGGGGGVKQEHKIGGRGCGKGGEFQVRGKGNLYTALFLYINWQYVPVDTSNHAPDKSVKITTGSGR